MTAGTQWTSADSGDSIDDRTILVGLIGQGIQQSRAPAMHEAAGRGHDLRLVYRLLDTDLMGKHPPSIADLLQYAEHFGFAGLNITYPYKQTVMAELDAFSDAAETVGAVNTVTFAKGRRIGHNTDYWGFRESFRRDMEGVPRHQVVLLGAGGAGVAVAPALLECGVENLIICDREAQRAQDLAARLTTRFGTTRVSADDQVAAVAASADGVVNATPVGMAKLPGTPLAAGLLRPTMWVADIVYFPLETELLRRAREVGCRTLSGAGMAVYQAVRAFELFTGVEPDSGLMEAAFRAFDETANTKRAAPLTNP